MAAKKKDAGNREAGRKKRKGSPPAADISDVCGEDKSAAAAATNGVADGLLAPAGEPDGLLPEPPEAGDEAPPPRPSQRRFPIVGIGASAGGLEALQEFFTT
jgi:chemotaxis response regulator CheB